MKLSIISKLTITMALALLVIVVIATAASNQHLDLTFTEKGHSGPSGSATASPAASSDGQQTPVDSGASGSQSKGIGATATLPEATAAVPACHDQASPGNGGNCSDTAPVSCSARNFSTDDQQSSAIGNGPINEAPVCTGYSSNACNAAIAENVQSDGKPATCVSCSVATSQPGTGSTVSTYVSNSDGPFAITPAPGVSISKGDSLDIDVGDIGITVNIPQNK